MPVMSTHRRTYAPQVDEACTDDGAAAPPSRCWNPLCVRLDCDGLYHVEVGWFGPIFAYRVEGGDWSDDRSWRGPELPIVPLGEVLSIEQVIARSSVGGPTDPKLNDVCTPEEATAFAQDQV